jgi:hypothetical protein
VFIITVVNDSPSPVLNPAHFWDSISDPGDFLAIFFQINQKKYPNLSKNIPSFTKNIQFWRFFSKLIKKKYPN